VFSHLPINYTFNTHDIIMKKSGIILSTILSILLFSCTSQRIPVTQAGAEEIFAAADNQSLQFDSRFVQPARGRSLNITGNYFLRITPDKVVADLPYFGRAYSAPIGSEGGIKFESADFDYQVRDIKKGGKEVSIKVNNSPVVREMTLTVFGNGSADLRVTPVNKQFISYRGEVRPLE